MNKSKLLQVLTFCLILILMGCTTHSPRMQRLNHLDSLMEEHPKEAYETLCKMASAIKKENTGKDKMKYRVLMAKAQNKLYLDMPSDSSFQEVVDYYDKNGTPNERMEAHYLMGCIYRDKKEAPMAMQCYQEAVECADTLSKDCDYVTLFSIYGQMADVFRKQNLYKEAVIAEKQYSTFAFKANDFLNFIRGKERLIPIYYSLRDTTKAIAMTKLCADLYNKYNYPKFAAGVYPILISYYISKGNYKMAGYYVNIFEKKSGAFDAKGNIAPHREHYYYLKGRYCLGIKQIDSANFYFRKVGCYGYRYESAKGLQALYELLQQRDSVLKYSRLCQKEMDEILLKQQTNAVKQAASMYNYNRMLKLYNEKETKAEHSEKKALVFALSFLVISMLFAFAVMLYREKIRKNKKELEAKQNEIEQWNDNYLQLLRELEQNKEELLYLEASKDVVIANKHQTIELLQNEIQRLKTAYEKASNSERNKVLDDDDIYKTFKNKAVAKRNNAKPKDSDWEQMLSLINSHFPLFYEKMFSVELSLLEKRVCILTRLRFTNNEMVVLLDSSPSSVSNAKQKVNEKLFGGTSASTLLKNMLKM